ASRAVTSPVSRSREVARDSLWLGVRPEADAGKAEAATSPPAPLRILRLVGSDPLSLFISKGLTPSQFYLSSGLLRTWNLINLLVVPLPPSEWNGARVAIVVQMPLPFHPPFGSSM